MSHAWIRLHAAVHILGQEGSARDRLTNAFTHYLLGLKPKEVPPEIRPDFIKLMQSAEKPYLSTRIRTRRAWVDAFAHVTDAEVSQMIRLIIDMYDVVTRYEPRPASTAMSRSLPSSRASQEHCRAA